MRKTFRFVVIAIIFINWIMMFYWSHTSNIQKLSVAMTALAFVLIGCRLWIVKKY